MTYIENAVDDAVTAARDAYDAAEKNPLGQGHAFVKGVDGRTSLAHALDGHDALRVDSGGYHGTTVHIEGVGRYVDASRAAYDAFIRTLESHNVDGTDGMHVWTRLS